MKTVWFPQFYTEAHRQPGWGCDLYLLLKQHGLECDPIAPAPGGKIDAVFCGSFFQFRTVALARASGLLHGVPVIHYNWDLYEFQIHEPIWQEYLAELERATLILVPTNAVWERTMQYLSRNATIVHPPVRVWEPVKRPAGINLPERGFVLDVMRKYPDPNQDLVSDVCSGRGIPFVATGCGAPWDHYRWYAANARVAVSAYFEASTGGLSLLEAYAHGTPVLVSDSPYHGARELFGDRALTFDWRSRKDFVRHLEQIWDHPWPPQPDCRSWVQSTYSEERFAARIAEEIKQWL